MDLALALAPPTLASLVAYGGARLRLAGFAIDAVSAVEVGPSPWPRVRASVVRGARHCTLAAGNSGETHYLLNDFLMAERVGFGLFPRGDSKELSGIIDPRDPRSARKPRSRHVLSTPVRSG